jgi:hypothetical protein
MDRLVVNQFEIEGCHKEMFVAFFEIDSDFMENKEYFREDTLGLGYKNEAHRCSEELYNEFFPDGEYDGFQETLSVALKHGAHMNTGGSQFILGNQCYTADYHITLVRTTGDDNYVVVVCYTTI